MLQTIRDKPWLAFVLLGPIILAMAFFGIGDYFTTKIETYSARIEGPGKLLGYGGQELEISQDEFRNRFELVRQSERERLGDAFDSGEFESLDNKRRVLDQMIDEEILGLVATREGVTVSETEVAATLKALPQFQVNGQYDADQYKLALASQGQTHAQFMARMRENMARDVLRKEIVGTGLVGATELDAFLKLSQQTRDISLLDLPTPALPEGAPSDADLRKWYDEHAAAYTTPEQVAIEYVEIDAASLPAPTPPSDDTLRALYTQQRARFVTDPRRSAAHILIKVPADADAAADAAARAKAAEIATQARAPGADFAALAAASSDDLGSKLQGGDLGIIEPKAYDPMFEQALFALSEVGDVTDPVRTSEGWHVIRLSSITPGTEKPFEEVRAELEQQYLATEQERVYSERAGRLLELIYRTPTALEPAAKELGLTLQRTPLFSRDRGEGIAALEPVRAAAFSDNQRIDRQVSDTLEVGPGHVVAIHVIDHQPEAVQPYEQVKDRVRADFDADRLADASQAQAEALLERARKGETLEALGTEVGRTVATVPAVARQAPMPPAMIEAIFAAPAPGGEQPSFGIARVGPDRHVLFQVTAIGEGDLSMLDDEMRKQLVARLAEARGVVEFQDFLKALRAQYKITVAEDRL